MDCDSCDKPLISYVECHFGTLDPIARYDDDGTYTLRLCDLTPGDEFPALDDDACWVPTSVVHLPSVVEGEEAGN